MANEPEKLMVNEVEYIRKDSVKKESAKKDGMEYSIVRGDRSGVFAGYIESREGKEVIIRDARRLWYWDGAASLSQLAIDGVSKPQNCKFPEEVTKLQVLDAIEIIPCTEKSRKSIACVGVWKQ